MKGIDKPLASEMRVQTSRFGDYYRDLIYLYAATSGDSPGNSVLALCKEALDGKAEAILNRVQWQADRAGVTKEEMIANILDGFKE